MMDLGAVLTVLNAKPLNIVRDSLTPEKHFISGREMLAEQEIWEEELN